MSTIFVPAAVPSGNNTRDAHARGEGAQAAQPTRRPGESCPDWLRRELTLEEYRQYEDLSRVILDGLIALGHPVGEQPAQQKQELAG